MASLAVCSAAQAHSGGSLGLLSAWLHPLTGADHFVAMIAVGAWSAQLGGRAVWTVPLAFLACMMLGGVVGFHLVDVPGVELGVALSVLLLGLAIGSGKRIAVPAAAFAVGVFGACHGYLHGYELTVLERPVLSTMGFMVTTACLHVVGLVMARAALKTQRGDLALKAAGWLAAAFGAYLLAARSWS